MNTIQKNLITIIEVTGLNPTRLSELSGVPQPTIHRILSGESSDPRSSTVARIAFAIGCGPGDLRDPEFDVNLVKGQPKDVWSKLYTRPDGTKEERIHNGGRISTFVKKAKAQDGQMIGDISQHINQKFPRDPVLEDLAALLPEDADVWRAQIRAAATKARRSVVEVSLQAAPAPAPAPAPNQDAVTLQMPRGVGKAAPDTLMIVSAEDKARHDIESAENRRKLAMLADPRVQQLLKEIEQNNK
jgi:hypothetical protein